MLPAAAGCGFDVETLTCYAYFRFDYNIVDNDGYGTADDGGAPLIATWLTVRYEKKQRKIKLIFVFRIQTNFFYRFILFLSCFLSPAVLFCFVDSKEA